MGILGWIFFGLLVGAVGKLLMPGRDPGGRLRVDPPTRGEGAPQEDDRECELKGETEMEEEVTPHLPRS